MIIIFKTKVFQKEIDLIQNETIRQFAIAAIALLPDYFFEVAASSSGKYHPAYALGNGGLVRHTKAAVHFASELLNLEFWQQEFDSDTRDLIITALILHDGIKHGIPKQNFCSADHPLVVVNYIKSHDEVTSILSPEQLEKLCGMIASHMGQWNTEWGKSVEILPKPKSMAEKFVHMCDYLASRKWLPVDFEDDFYDPAKLSNANELQDKIKEIIDVCRKMVADGKDRESLYDVIKNNNNGNRQPNSIKDIQTADKILTILGGM